MAAIQVEQHGSVATVTLFNPGKRNALTLAMWQGLARTFRALSEDLSLRCVIVRGNGGHFAAGADIADLATVRATAEAGLRYHEDVASALHAIAHGLHPTVAAIEGNCVGGGLEIACACDLRIAAPDARFGIPINRLGFSLAPEELSHLLQLVGRATALEILLEGRVFNAVEAQAKGLLHRIADDVSAEADATAHRIAAGAPLAARMHRKLIRRLLPAAPALEGQELRDAFSILSSDDHREGVRAFIEKRKPAFKGT
jgi:enoyl-CoA hydratase